MRLALHKASEEGDASELTDCINAILSLTDMSNSSVFLKCLTPTKSRRKTLIWLYGLLETLNLRLETHDQAMLLARYSLAKRAYSYVESQKLALSCLYIAVKLAGDFTPQLASMSKYRKLELGLSNSELARLEMEILSETPPEIFKVSAVSVFLKSLLALMHPLIVLSDLEFLKCKKILDHLWIERPSINIINATLACFAFISNEPTATLLDANVVLNEYFAQIFSIDLGYKVNVAQFYLRSLLYGTTGLTCFDYSRVTKPNSLIL